HRPGRDPAAGGRGRRDLPSARPAGRADRADRGVAVRVVIAEDNALLRDGLELLLTHSGHEVTATVDNAPALLATLDAARPDDCVAAPGSSSPTAAPGSPPRSTTPRRCWPRSTRTAPTSSWSTSGFRRRSGMRAWAPRSRPAGATP